MERDIDRTNEEMEAAKGWQALAGGLRGARATSLRIQPIEGAVSPTAIPETKDTWARIWI